jgi:hypothetical protein
MFRKSASTQSRPAGARSTPGNGRRQRLVIGILLLGVIIFATGKYLRAAAEKPAGDIPEYRMPVANPVLEPDRPDLIGEPRIDE